MSISASILEHLGAPSRPRAPAVDLSGPQRAPRTSQEHLFGAQGGPRGTPRVSRGAPRVPKGPQRAPPECQKDPQRSPNGAKMACLGGVAASTCDRHRFFCFGVFKVDAESHSYASLAIVYFIFAFLSRGPFWKRFWSHFDSILRVLGRSGGVFGCILKPQRRQTNDQNIHRKNDLEKMRAQRGQRTQLELPAFGGTTHFGPRGGPILIRGEGGG